MQRKIIFSMFASILFIPVIGISFQFIKPARAVTMWTVDDDGPADFHTIQEAIDAASGGDIIRVASGVYYEHISPVGITLVGEDVDTTIIDGNGTGTVISGRGTDANVTGFAIRNGDYGIKIRGGFGIFPEYVGLVLNGNRIVDNNYGGVHLQLCAECVITNNVIANNPLFGIHLFSSGNNTIINNTVMNNGHGIDLRGNTKDNFLRNNSIIDNTYNFGFIIRGDTRDWIFAGPDEFYLSNDIDTSNTVDGKPIIYWVDQHDRQVPKNAGYVLLAACSNITVEELSVSNNLHGILLILTNTTLIANNNITSNANGIYTFANSYNNTIIGNNLKDNLMGIRLGVLSWFTTMRNNSISGGQMNFGVSPDIPDRIAAEDLINDVDTSNTVDGKPIIYWVDQHDRQVPKNAGYVMLINCTNILIDGLNLSNNLQNIFILASNNTVISNNSITNSLYGIDVRGYRTFYYSEYYSVNTTIIENTLIDNAVGLRLQSHLSTISNNTLYRNLLGLCTLDSSYCTISGNMVVASDLPVSPPYELWMFYDPEFPWERSAEVWTLELGGIVAGGAYNLVYDNTVMNSHRGISMWDHYRNYRGNGNIVFHNNLINNRFQTMESPSGRNYWDNGYPSGGNYYSDYTGNDTLSGPDQDQLGSDGIGDTPYTIFSSSNITDRYPLMDLVPCTPTPPLWMEVRIETGDWIKYDYTITGAPPGSVLPEWMKVEFVDVEGTIANLRVTMHMSDGTEQNETMIVDLLAGNGTIGAFSGFIIPANSAAGDFVYMSSLGNAVIIGESTGKYAGASRETVYTFFRQQDLTELTYYWDKQTGMMVESIATMEGFVVIAIAIETNMWINQELLFLCDINDDRTINILDITIVAVAFDSGLGDPNWDSRADINGDEVINILDIAAVATHFGETFEP